MKQYEGLSVSVLRFEAKDVITASEPWRGPGFSRCGCLISHCEIAADDPIPGRLHDNCNATVHDCGY